jgi:hypothetical protein
MCDVSGCKNRVVRNDLLMPTKESTSWMCRLHMRSNSSTCLLMASGVYRSSSSLEAFIGSDCLLVLPVLELLDKRPDAHVVLIAVLLFAFLVAVLMLALKLHEKTVHNPLALDLLVAVGRGRERKRGVGEKAYLEALGEAAGKGSEREEGGADSGSLGRKTEWTKQKGGWRFLAVDGRSNGQKFLWML